MAISTPQVSVDSALSAINALAVASAAQLDEMAAQVNTQLYEAANNMKWSKNLVASINNPELQSSIRNSIKGLQSDIQNSINNATAGVNQNVRAAQIANGFSTVATGAAVITSGVVEDQGVRVIDPQ
jgi:X-X-X-Leu-X-X-Gly heptad repeat protein